MAASEEKKTVQSTPLVTPKPITLKVDEEKWCEEKRTPQPPRPQSHGKQKAIFNYIKELLEHDCIVPGSDWRRVTEEYCISHSERHEPVEARSDGLERRRELFPGSALGHHS
jgi:hypothetical protein